MIPLCDQTVTVYRCTGTGLVRQVVDGCFCTWQDSQKEDILGGHPVRKFRLFLPREAGSVAPGDWVCQGEGPEDVIFPSQIPGAEQVLWVKPMQNMGWLPHTEAGNG